MPKFRHYVSTAHRISAEYYGRAVEKLAGIGQGNKFSRDMRRDVSCLTIK